MSRFFVVKRPATPETYTYVHTLSPHDALPVWPQRIQHRPLSRIQRPAHIGDRHARRAEGGRRGRIIGAEARALGDPPPRLADLKLDAQPRRDRNPDKVARQRLQPANRLRIGGRYQGRWRQPYRPRRRPHTIALLTL